MRSIISWFRSMLERRHLYSQMRAAVHDWNVPEIQLLVELGFDPNWRVSRTTLLHLAISRDDRPLIAFLLNKGAQIPRSPWTICNAVSNRSFKLIELAIEQGLDVNRRPHRCMSPLEIAIDEHDVEAVRFLIDHGADESSLRFIRWHTVSPKVAKILASYGFYVHPCAFT